METTMTQTTRVLIVDDEEAVRTFAERALRLAGYETVVAADGPDALRIWNDQGPFDLLLADVVMPGMQGNELARRLRLVEPDVKVLYFTGYSDQLFTDKAPLGENEAFVEKPINMRGLLEAVALILFGHIPQLGRGIFADKAQHRSVRVPTPPLHVRIAETPGRLVNVSASGALVYAEQGLRPERESPMHIDVEPEPVEVRARVTRSHAVPIPWPDSSWQHQEYAVAVAFTELPPKAMEALKTLCGDTFSRLES